MGLGAVCEVFGGHWFKTWEPFRIPEAPRASFEHTQCKVCRQWYVRPTLRPLSLWPVEEPRHVT